MKLRFAFPLLLVLGARLGAAPTFNLEAGASYFALRHTQLERGSYAFAIDEPSEVAPYVSATHIFNDRFGLRLSYHYLNNVETTATLGSQPGSLLPVVVFGHYEDDVHLVTAAPEFTWTVRPWATIAIAPELNWVASRGVIRYSTNNNPTVLLVAPRGRNDDGFTLGGSVRVLFPLGARSSISAGYRYVDLDPSFGREAHVFSGGLQWRF